ncbi:glycosyltransferase family 2 protein [Haloterrigena sp. SYSU A121-1]|uniref:Glycosyltransferase family 2 protein n=1 Tax=Haloterrigena gelatinilytica TaxID=2741724 RepID=A0A8J8GRB0_9EURY|nr:glycosyltransferase family 2 protein [Haloterrigena gelatinilytica]NUB93735.1 glycosyltransferase family 2 protein [Haloterrigena gelatinilytica]
MGETSKRKALARHGKVSGGSVAVIIPTFNERENIKTTLDRCLRVLEATEYAYELIVVDDDSPDRTWEFVETAYAGDDRVRVLRRTENRGLALSIVAGLRTASTAYCAVIDADLQHPPEKIPDLLAALDAGADISIGSRHIEDGEIENWSRFRTTVSKGATALTKRFLPTARRISDPMSGMFAVRRSVVDNVDLQPQGYKILLEIISKCDVEEVTEVPYTFRERTAGESKLSADQYQEFVEHLLELSVGEYANRISENPRRVVRMLEFFAVGAVGVLVNIIVFLLLMKSGTHYLVSGSFAFLAAVQWNFVGNWAITFDRPSDALTKRYVAFHAVCLVGLIVYEIVLSLLLFVPALPVLLANVGAIGASSVWNFVGADTTAFAENIENVEISIGPISYTQTATEFEGGSD